MEDKTTIFYEFKLKRTRTPADLFEKLKKSFKKTGPTKKWSYDIYGEQSAMRIDFGDDKSETFRLYFDDKKCCKGWCKVYFPLSGEEFDNEKKSDFKALVNMIYSARSYFSEMKFRDDYGIAESYLDSKVNKITLRELTDDEIDRANRLFSEGHTDIKEFITALMYDYRGLPYSEDFIPYINRHIGLYTIMSWDSHDEQGYYFSDFVESFLVEVTEYGSKGRLYTIDDYYGELTGTSHAVFAFSYGIEVIAGFIDDPIKGADPKGVQVMRLYRNKYLPLLETLDNDFERCLLAYRFFVSAMDYLTFKIVGKDNKISEHLIDDFLVEGVKKFIETHDTSVIMEATGKHFKKYANFKKRT